MAQASVLGIYFPDNRHLLRPRRPTRAGPAIFSRLGAAAGGLRHPGSPAGERQQKGGPLSAAYAGRVPFLA